MRLRGHHLICLQFFKGEGYNEKFVKKLEDVVKKAKNGEKIDIVYGVDEVCETCPYLIDDTCNYDEESRNETYEIDDFALKLLDLSVGDTVFWKEIENKLPKIIDEWRSKVCINCDWRESCALGSD